MDAERIQSSMLVADTPAPRSEERPRQQPLVLSLFPGIGLLDMAFEQEGFCVVRGPDLLWGGDVRAFHPPSGKFDGVIGGPPCKAFANMTRVNIARGLPMPEDLIPEFERCVSEAQPDWFVMENVDAAPLPFIDGYHVQPRTVVDADVGGVTSRARRFSFGSRSTEWFYVETVALYSAEIEHAVTSRGTTWDPEAKRARSRTAWADVAQSLRKQGLPADFFHRFQFATGRSVLTSDGAQAMLGNGVPLPMGRAIAKAVKRAMYPECVEVAV